jgi:hypothetical protein
MSVQTARQSVEGPRRLKAIAFGAASGQDGSAESRDGPCRNMFAISERQQHYAIFGEGQ